MRGWKAWLFGEASGEGWAEVLSEAGMEEACLVGE